MIKQALPLIRRFLRTLLRLLPILAAVAIVVLLVRTRTGPEKKEISEAGRALRVITVPEVALVPRARGYGLAAPRRIWRAVAEVKGDLVFTHPKLESGALIETGEVLVKINPADYELAVARLQASIQEARARLRELEAEAKSQNASLAIEKRSLSLARKSLDRLRELLERDAVAADTVDREERNVLQQEQTIQKIENSLAQIPARRETLEAALAAHEANLQQAKLDVQRTAIRTPYNCRLGEVKLQSGQYVTAGQLLFEAQGTDEAEVEAKLRPEQLRNLLPPEKRRQFEPGISMERLQKLFDLDVTIRSRSGDWEATWSARFDRIRETVDPRTRAMNVVAVVNNPYEQIIPGIRPALTEGMYCEMELRAPPRPDTVVLPRNAARDGRVFLVDDQNRLRKRHVDIAFAQDDLIVIAAGLNGGETVIVSDPAPAIEGMKIVAVHDDELRERIVAQAENHGEATP